jgi:hypothetical protein
MMEHHETILSIILYGVAFIIILNVFFQFIRLICGAINIRNTIKMQKQKEEIEELFRKSKERDEGKS